MRAGAGPEVVAGAAAAAQGGGLKLGAGPRPVTDRDETFPRFVEIDMLFYFKEVSNRLKTTIVAMLSTQNLPV